jgi:hypothetical protein
MISNAALENELLREQLREIEEKYGSLDDEAEADATARDAEPANDIAEDSL